MELKIKDRDYVADGAGGLVRVSGWDELLERVLFKLSVRRGSFALAPELGSKLHLLWREKGESRATAAKQYVAEALADEKGLSVTGMELAEKNGFLELRVLLRYEKLLGEIEAALQKKREIAVDVEVKAPTEKTVNMSAELTAEQGWTMQEITDAATAALQAYFTGERLGEAVYTAKLASILYGVEGVKNCHLLTPDEDVSVSATELPVLGTVTITEIGAGEA